MCGGGLGSILPLVADAVTAYVAPELLPVVAGGGQTISGLANGEGLGKALTQGLTTGGLTFGGQELVPALSNATGIGGGGANSLTDLLGQTTGGGSLAGTGTIGGDATGLYNYAANSGLGSLLGGTSNSANALNSDATGVLNAPSAGTDVATSAATPSASISTALPSGGVNLGGAAGGVLPGGSTGASSLGEESLPFSASGTGAGSGAIDLSPLNTSNLLQSSDLVSQASPSPGLLSQGLGALTGNAPTPAGYAGGLTLSGDGSFASGLNPEASGALDSGVSTTIPTIGGTNVGTVANTGGQSAGANITNSLLRGGLGYLLNSPNTGGANAINSATQQAQAGFAPYTAAGKNAENTLAALYGNNGTAAQTAAQQGFQNTPGYQFAQNQGINAVDANAAALGQTLSGNNQQAVNNYAQGTANQTYNNYVNQLQNLASGGLSAAGGSGTAGLTGASAISQLDQNKADNLNTAVATGLQGLFPSGGINLAQLLSGNGGGGGNQAGLLQYLFPSS